MRWPARAVSARRILGLPPADQPRWATVALRSLQRQGPQSRHLRSRSRGRDIEAAHAPSRLRLRRTLVSGRRPHRVPLRSRPERRPGPGVRDARRRQRREAPHLGCGYERLPRVVARRNPHRLHVGAERQPRPASRHVAQLSERRAFPSEGGVEARSGPRSLAHSGVQMRSPSYCPAPERKKHDKWRFHPRVAAHGRDAVADPVAARAASSATSIPSA